MKRSIVLSLVVIFFLIILSTGLTLAAVSPGDGPLQFVSGNHVLGFQPGLMYLAGADHALRIEFVGAWARKPQASGPERSLAGKPPPFVEAIYHDLWDGVTLVYESRPGMLVKSTYHVKPGNPSAVKKIRLKYNRPVRVAANGSLIIDFENGQMVESKPLAWQDIDGRRVMVEAAWRSMAGRGAGFEVGAYDPTTPW